jgi:hypothetical protein
MMDDRTLAARLREIATQLRVSWRWSDAADVERAADRLISIANEADDPKCVSCGKSLPEAPRGWTHRCVGCTKL